ncbi:MAG TPA: histidinol-phosphate transaminase [Dissulfurispiraceae bacterium]|nr:histidinol-phosphate transaminase [Dissulfurispiraceae bacterium]
MKKDDLSRLVRPNVRALRAYEAKEVPCKIKLDANESPYSPLPSDAAFGKSDALSALNRYPDPEAKALKKALAGMLKVNERNLLLGNGSDELIYYLITTFGGPVLFPTPTFVMYGIIAQALGEKPVAVPLDKDFDLDTGRMLAVVKKEKPKLTFLSSPNNPTGNCYSADRILKIVKASRGIVVVDEAYQPFSSSRGFLPLIRDYKNLIILRTMSKIGFAALRVGYMIGNESLILEVNKVRLPYNLNSLSQAAALECIRNRKIVEARTRQIASERKRLFDALSGLEGVEPYPSEANFILFKVADSRKTFSGLLQRGILVKNMDKVIRSSLRVTVGTPEENTLFIKALKTVIGK